MGNSVGDRLPLFFRWKSCSLNERNAGGGEKIVRVSPGGVDWESVGGGTKVAAVLNNRSV